MRSPSNNVNKKPIDTEDPPEAIADLNAEASVIASMLIGGPDAVATGNKLLEDTDFYREANAELFRSLLALHQRGASIDAVTLNAELTTRGTIDDVGGISYVLNIGDFLPTSAHLADYARIVRDRSTRRKVIESAVRIAGLARSASVPVSDIQAELARTTDEAANRSEPFPHKPGSLAAELLPLPRMNPGLLPDLLRPWVYDIAQRMSCPIEYVAAPAIVAVSALIGRRLAIRPKQRDDWTVVPNLWGAIVGSPGALKTPAVSEALKPMFRIEKAERLAYEESLKSYKADQLIGKAQTDAAKGELNRRAKQKGVTPEELKALAAQAVDTDQDEPPTCPRLVVNDTTVEKLGELLKENPNGLLQFRDELAGFLRSLDKQGHETDRAFYLESWNGDKSFDYDRIGRGNVHIPAVCVSLFGTIQPAVIARFIRGGVDDGFPQRLQIMVYPDPPRTYHMVDRYPNTDSKNRVFEVLEWLYHLTPAEVGAIVEEGELPYVRFAPDAQEFFYGWFERLENRLRSMTETPAFVAHLSKFRSLMPSLALIMHLLSEKLEGNVSLASAERAAQWCDFLEAHARRVYVMATEGDAEPAQTLAGKIKGGTLPDPFTYRQVVQKGWSGLSDTDAVARAVAFLESRHWVRVLEVQPTQADGEKRGRPSAQIYRNPALQFSDKYDSTHLQKLQKPDDLEESLIPDTYENYKNPSIGRGSAIEELVTDDIRVLGAQADAELASYFSS